MPKVGDMVRASNRLLTSKQVVIGTVVEIKEVTDLFSEKYAILETNTQLHVLCDGEIKVLDLEDWSAEVINESR